VNGSKECPFGTSDVLGKEYEIDKIDPQNAPEGSDAGSNIQGADQQVVELLTKVNLRFVIPGHLFFNRTAVFVILIVYLSEICEIPLAKNIRSDI
jgi:hypothetical protein